jgi:hypothetical protein
MKIFYATSFVAVLLLLCVSVIYAGYGQCMSPEPTVTVAQSFTYYPSGNPHTSSIISTTNYGSQYCEGVEGNCDTIFNAIALAGYVSGDFWSYNDTTDDATRLKDHQTSYNEVLGRIMCWLSI